MRIEIFSTHAAQIRAHASHAFPDECCGLLIGAGERVTEVVEAANVAADPARFFEIDPAILIAAHRRAREARLAVIGHYHSHPGGDLRPSPRDAAAANADAVWLMASDRELTAWRFDGAGAFLPVDLVVLP